jgi:DNA-binding MarR family transcriptional regulator
MDMSIYNSMYMIDLSRITTYQAGVIQAGVHRSLQKECDAILKQFDITKMQWLMIGTVLDSGSKGIRISDLAKKLGTTMGYLTNNLKVLELKGMISRQDSGSDSRSRLVIVNPKFAPMCKKIESTLREGLRKSIYSKVKPEEFLTYMRVMDKLNK